MNFLNCITKHLGNNLEKISEVQIRRQVIRERKRDAEKRIIELHLELELLQKEHDNLYIKFLELNEA